MKTTFGTHDQTSYILNRRRRQHRGKRLDKEFNKLNDCMKNILLDGPQSSRGKLGQVVFERVELRHSNCATSGTCILRLADFLKLQLQNCACTKPLILSNILLQKSMWYQFFQYNIPSTVFDFSQGQEEGMEGG